MYAYTSNLRYAHLVTNRVLPKMRSGNSGVIAISKAPLRVYHGALVEIRTRCRKASFDADNLNGTLPPTAPFSLHRFTARVRKPDHAEPKIDEQPPWR